MTRDRLLTLVRWLVLAAVVALGASYLVHHTQELGAIAELRLDMLPWLLLMPLLAFLCVGLLNNVLVASFGVRLRFVEWYGLAVLVSMAHHLLPLGLGMSVRAAYLKTRRGFPLSAFISTQAVTYVLHGFLAAVIATGCIVAGGGLEDPVLRRLALALGAGALALSGLFFLRTPRLPERAPLPASLRARVEELLVGWESLRRNRRVLGLSTLVLLANFAVLAANMKLCFYALSIDCDAAAAIAMASLLAITRVVSITPANLGVMEAFVALLSQAFGIGFDEGLLAALVWRIPLTLATFGLGPVFAVLLSSPPAADETA